MCCCSCKDPTNPVKCPDPCTTRTFPPLEVNESRSETISNAPPAHSAWNGTYSWQSKFRLEVNRPSCRITVTIKIKVSGTVTNAQKSAWKAAIESKWNNKVKLICPDPACRAACTNGYPVLAVVQYVTSGEHYTVTANNPAATAGGRAGQGGTTSMTGWGVNDTVDVAHEFGHMLGNRDEYFTTNGVDYTYGGTRRGFRDASGGIMNNPANDPLPRNYEFIRQKAASVMGVSCTTQVI